MINIAELAWAAQARWLWERTPESQKEFERALKALSSNSKGNQTLTKVSDSSGVRASK